MSPHDKGRGLNVKMVLLVGNDSSALKTLSELVHTVCAGVSRGPTIVLTALEEDTVLDILSQHHIDALIATYDHTGLSYDFIRWLNQGRFGIKMALVATEGDQLPAESELRTHGVDAIVERPVNEHKLKTVLGDWFG